MNKDKQVACSKKGKNDSSEHHTNKQIKPKPCKKTQGQGLEKQHTSRFHSEGKSQKPTKRRITKQKSESRLRAVKASEELSEWKQQYSQLQGRYESVKKQLYQLKSRIRNYEDQIATQGKLIRSYSKKPPADGSRNLISEAQTLTREAVEKYKALSQEFEAYKAEAEMKLQSQRRKHQAAIIRVKEQYETKILRLQCSTNRQHEVFKVRQQEAIKQTDLKICREQVKRLKLENQQLVRRIQEQREGFRRKESQFKSNLLKITQRVQNWEEQNEKIRTIEQQNESLKEEYQTLLEKYQRRRQKQHRKTQEWGMIFQQFLGQINRLKRQIEFNSVDTHRGEL